jgi:uncharacterized protein
MIIDITRLKSGIDKYALIDLNYSFSAIELENTNIIKLDNVSIKGNITKDYEGYNLSCVVIGSMVLPCSVSLKPTNYDFSIEIDEILDENYKNNQNSIDIFPIIWENILMEIPIRIVNEDIADVKKEGEGWKLITEED